MELQISRRRFLRGALREPPELRPPGARAEAAFLAACTRCGECITACPTGIVVAGSGGFPRVHFALGECTFCGACARACSPGVLALWSETPDDAPERAWTLNAAIGERCLARAQVVCRTCAEACPSGAIRFGYAAGAVPVPSIDFARCTGCGACYGPCPTAAIEIASRHTG
jgi:ferredoxin-type protein NapF